MPTHPQRGYVFAWVCVCMGVCVHGCVCAWVCVCMGVCVHGCVCAWVCVYKLLRLLICPEDTPLSASFTSLPLNSDRNEECTGIFLLFVRLLPGAGGGIRSSSKSRIYGWYRVNKHIYMYIYIYMYINKSDLTFLSNTQGIMGNLINKLIFLLEPYIYIYKLIKK